MTLPVIFQPVVVAGGADATLTYVTFGAMNSAATTFAFTSRAIGTASADRQILVSVCRNTATSVSSVTVGGISATAVVTSGGAGIWIAAVPTGTTADIVVTFSSSVTGVYFFAHAAYDLKSTTARGTAALNSAALVHDLDVDVPKGGFVIAHSTKTLAVAATTDWVGITERSTVAIGVGVGDTVTYGEASAVTPSGTPRDVSITWDDASSMRSVAASFR